MVRTAGLLTTYASWRWAFYLQAIMTACFVVAVFFFVPNDSRSVSRREPIDWFGALLVSAGLCSFCFALTDAETSPHGWATSYIIVSLVLGVACIGMFIWLQARLNYPLMPLKIFRYPQFPRVIATYFLGFTTFAGVLVFNYSLMWQLVFGRKAVGVYPVLKYNLTTGRNMEYPTLDNRTTDKLCRIVHSTSCIRYHFTHSRRDGHPRCGTPSSATISRRHLLGYDLPIPPAHDHGCRILVSRLLSLRSRIRPKTSSLGRGWGIYFSHVSRFGYRCCRQQCNPSARVRAGKEDRRFSRGVLVWCWDGGSCCLACIDSSS